METNKLYLGDCFDVMETLPEQSVDMILCDLPYGTTDCKWDSILSLSDLWAAWDRVAKNACPIVLTSTFRFAVALVESNSTNFKHEWFWNKKMSGSFAIAKYRPLPIVELILVFSSDGKRVNYFPEMEARGPIRDKRGYTNTDCYGIDKAKGKANRSNTYYPKNCIEISNAKQRGKIHPTQKPVALFEYLIRTYTKTGEVVLDNCIGSGTTAIAAMNTGRRWIGIEKDFDYYQKAKERIESHE